MFKIDVSPLQPKAQSIVRQAAAIYLRHTAPWFIGLVAHGSALKGGIIPGCSDVDLQLYLQDSAFTPQGHLPLELGFTIHRDIAELDLKPFRYLQCYPLSSKLPEGYVGPIPGAYHLITGKLPVPEATAAQLRSAAEKALTELDPSPAFIIGNLIGPGGVRLSRRIRLLCTKVWPVLYQVLTIQRDNAIAVWCLPKNRAIQLLPRNTTLSQSIRRFHQAVRTYYPAENSTKNAIAVIRSGFAFLKAAKAWWREVGG